MNGARENWLRICGGIVVVVVAAVLLWRVRGVVITVLVAVVFAYVLRPLVDLLCRPGLLLKDGLHHLPRPLATGIVFVFLVVIVLEIGSLSAPPLTRQINELQVRWPRYRAEIADFAAAAERFQREQLPAFLQRAVQSWETSWAQLATSAARRGLGLTVHGVGLLVELILVPIIAFYVLADGPAIRRQVLFFVPRRYLGTTEQAMSRADDVFARYIKGQVILCVIAFAAVSLGLWAIGVEFYLILGVVAGITRAIPIVGPLVGAVPILIVVLLATKSGVMTFWVLILFTLMHLLESKFLMPAIIGRQLNIHPVLIIIALLVGAQMGGLLGMFLAAPVLAAVRTLVAERRSEGAEHAA